MAKMTRHGARRLRRRLTTGVHSDRVYLNRVLEYGLTVDEAGEPLGPFMRAKRTPGRRVLVYAQALHVFGGNRLVTVYRLPQELRTQADQLCGVKRRRLEAAAARHRAAKHAERAAKALVRNRRRWLADYERALDERM